MKTRIAVIRGAVDELDRIRRYLPENYRAEPSENDVVVFGIDRAGWTLDGYVLPRLASGLVFGTELTEILR